MKYGNRRLFRRIAASPITLGFLLIVCFIIGKAAWNIHEKAQFTEVKLSQAELELAKLEEREKELSVKVGRLSTEEGVEAEMRTKYRAIREGELVAVIIDEDRATAAVISATSTPALGWWGRMLRRVGIGD